MNNKRFFLVILLFMPSVIMAVPSLNFSTIPGVGPSWLLAKTATPGNFDLTFYLDARAVATTNPSPDPVLHDIMNIGKMTLSGINDHGTYASGQLTTSGNLTIKRDDAPFTNVFTATIKPGAMVTFSTNFLAFDIVKDDLDVTFTQLGYSSVLDAFAAGDSEVGLDWSFSGTRQTTGDIYRFVTGKDQNQRCICGTIDGQITTMIPAPGAIALTSIGVALIGWSRRRRM